MPANTPKGLPYPLPSEPVAEGAQAIRNLAEAVDTKVLVVPSSSPPASPVDGTRWLFPADAANGVYWEFVYRAASSNWVFVGGSPLTAYVGSADPVFNGQINTWNTTHTNIGPDIIVPRTGVYIIRFGCQITNAAAALASASIADATINNNPIIPAPNHTIPAGGYVTLFQETITASLITAHTLRFVCWQNVTGSYFAIRQLSLTPIRIT